MKLELRKATASDAKALTDIYYSAFSKDAISLLVFPRNNPAPWKWWYDSVIEELADPNAHFICIYDSDSTDQKVIAYGKWNSPEAVIDTNLPTWPEGADLEVAEIFFGGLVRTHEKLMRGRKHWYLEFVATLPEYQGKGAAGKILRWGIAKADDEGTEAYLEASPDGKPIYEHLGFKEVDRLVVELEGKGLEETEFVECFMVRSPVSKKS